MTIHSPVNATPTEGRFVGARRPKCPVIFCAPGTDADNVAPVVPES